MSPGASQQFNHKCEFCGVGILLRELPSGRLLAYESPDTIHRCKAMKRGGKRTSEPVERHAKYAAPASPPVKSDIFEIADLLLGFTGVKAIEPAAFRPSKTQNQEAVSPHRRKADSDASLVVRPQAVIEWNDPLLRRSVLQWYKVRPTQYLLTLPGREELVITNRDEEWYVKGRVEGRVIPAGLYRSLGEALIHAERYFRRRGIRLMAQVRREDRWRLSGATPIQQALLKSLGHPPTQLDALPKDAATELIRQYVRGER